MWRYDANPRGGRDYLAALFGAALLVNRAREFRPNHHDEARIPISGDGTGGCYYCARGAADDFWRAREGAGFAEKCAGGNRTRLSNERARRAGAGVERGEQIFKCENA